MIRADFLQADISLALRNEFVNSRQRDAELRFTLCHNLMVSARICEIFALAIWRNDENMAFELCNLLWVVLGKL